MPGPQLLREYHPCNPVIRDGIPYIKVNSSGEYNRMAEPRPAIPDPNKSGCYILSTQQGARRKHSRKNKKHIHRRHSHRRHTRRHK